MKPLARAKERLADAHSPAERRALSLAMLADVIAAACALDAVWCICSDDEAADVAHAAGAIAVPDHNPDDGLNASLAATTHEALGAGARGMLIISADCAAATRDDVRAVALGDGVSLAPDRTGRGTNALWRQPPDLITTSFGPNSRRSHQGLAYASRIPFAVIPRERLAIDADTVADLEQLAIIGAGPATTEVLASLGYPRRGR